MNIIATKGEELEVISLVPYAYTNGKSEKFLRVKVSAENTTFDELRALFEGNEDPIEYYEDDALKCEYNGYSSFDCTYHEGVFTVELQKGTLTTQINALLVSNEKLLTANAKLEESNKLLTESNELVVGQNELLNATLTDLLEFVIPDMIAGVMAMLEDHELRLGALEEYDTTNDTETGESGAVSG